MTSLIYNTGTVTVTNGSATVTGSLTGWAVALVEGGMFSCDGFAVPIVSVEDDTHLTLAYDWPGTTGGGKTYAIARESSEATARAATWTVDRLAKLAQTPWGTGVIPDGRGSLAERNAVTPLPNDDYCWLRVEVDEPAELYFRDGGVWLGPYPFRGEQGTAGVGSGGYGLPAGGTTGQVPRKASGTNGDVAWEALDIAPRVPVNNGGSGVTVDFDTITTPGWYNRVLTTDTGMHGPGANGTFYFMQVIATAGTNLIQIAYPYRVTTEKVYVRSRFSGVWTAWKQLAYADEVQPLDALLSAISGLTTADGKFMAFTGVDTPAVRDIVGTVAQSAGIPTGALIESGSNANGVYVRWSDGTQICVGVTDVQTTASAYGPFFFNNTPCRGTFAAAFSVAPQLIFNADRGAGSGAMRLTGSLVEGVTTTTPGGMRSVSAANTDTVTHKYAAIGRWF